MGLMREMNRASVHKQYDVGRSLVPSPPSPLPATACQALHGPVRGTAMTIHYSTRACTMGP